jgi:hypothetical protein
VFQPVEAFIVPVKSFAEPVHFGGERADMAIDDSDRTLDAVEPVDDAVQLIVHALDAPTQHCEIHGISHQRLALPTAEVVWAAIRALPATAAPACALTDSGPAGTAPRRHCSAEMARFLLQMDAPDNTG